MRGGGGSRFPHDNQLAKGGPHSARSARYLLDARSLRIIAFTK